jgi:hypothetical protein
MNYMIKKRVIKFLFYFIHYKNIVKNKAKYYHFFMEFISILVPIFLYVDITMNLAF